MKSGNKKYWEQRHKEYSGKDWINETTIFAKQALEYFPNKGKLIDFSAGQGQDSRFFAQHGFTVTSHDYSDYALKIARQKAKSAGVKMEFKQFDLAEPLPFPDQYFDIAYSHLGLHYFDEPTTLKLFREMHRILIDEGILAIILNPISDPEIEEDELEQIAPNYYRTARGLYKRYFSIEEVQKFTKGIFKPLLLDQKGRTLKDNFGTLIRFIGRRV